MQNLNRSYSKFVLVNKMS